MVDEANTTAATGEKKKRKPQGPRTPQPIYVFVKNHPETGQPQVTKSFKNPRSMAEYVPTSQANGETLLVLTPE